MVGFHQLEKRASLSDAHHSLPSTCLTWVSMPSGPMNSANSSAPGVAVGVTS